MNTDEPRLPFSDAFQCKIDRTSTFVHCELIKVWPLISGISSSPYSNYVTMGVTHDTFRTDLTVCVMQKRISEENFISG